VGIRVELGPDWISVAADQPRRIISDPSGGMPVIADGLWPQFPSDLMSVMLLLATQVEGTVLFFEKLYESRMYFVDRLISMGANAVICDPHRVVVCGASQLHGIELSSPDIRAGISLVGAALCAPGRSVISNVQLIDRGYEAIEQRLKSLGARLTRHSDGEVRP
jgi:UDP-N-acetylglucosamine 1-carboxyvinyltransferase